MNTWLSHTATYSGERIGIRIGLGIRWMDQTSFLNHLAGLGLLEHIPWDFGDSENTV